MWTTAGSTQPTRHSARMGKRSRQRRRDAAAVVEAVQRPITSDDQRQPELVVLVRRRQRLDTEIATEVARLRRAGVSWTVIGQALGVSRQGARQRYAGTR